MQKPRHFHGEAWVKLDFYKLVVVFLFAFATTNFCRIREEFRQGESYRNAKDKPELRDAVLVKHAGDLFVLQVLLMGIVIGVRRIVHADCELEIVPLVRQIGDEDIELESHRREKLAGEVVRGIRNDVMVVIDRSIGGGEAQV